MSNFEDAGGTLFLAQALTGGVTITATSEETDYPASASLDVLYPQHGWRSTSRSAQTLVLDVGIELTCGVYLSRANFAGITVQANPTNVWTAPAVSHVLTIPKDRLLDRRQIAVFWTLNREDVDLRYIRLVIAAQDADDSAGYYTVPTIIPMQSPVEVALRKPIHLTRHRPMLENQLATGREMLRLGERALTLELPWEFAWDLITDTDEHETDDMHGLAVDEDTPVIVCWDARHPELGILAYRRGDIQIQSPDGVGASMPLVFEEITR